MFRIWALGSVWRIRDFYPVSRILIFTHPGSRIPNPKTATEERGEQKFSKKAPDPGSGSATLLGLIKILFDRSE
jgi:hypothetical protein